MKKVIKFALIFLLLFTAVIMIMCKKAENDINTKYNQVLYGEKQGKDMSYCNSRASAGIEDYTSCMQRIRDNSR